MITPPQITMNMDPIYSNSGPFFPQMSRSYKSGPYFCKSVPCFSSSDGSSDVDGCIDGRSWPAFGQMLAIFLRPRRRKARSWPTISDCWPLFKQSVMTQREKMKMFGFFVRKGQSRQTRNRLQKSSGRLITTGQMYVAQS